MRWPLGVAVQLVLTMLALVLGPDVGALPPGAEQVVETRRYLAALQEDLRALVLEHLEALAFDHELFEDHLELLSEAVQDLLEHGGVYRPEQVRVLLDQAEEILEAFLFQLEQALDMLDDVADRLLDLQSQLDDLKNEKLLSERLHQRATRALTLAQHIVQGRLRPPLDNLQALSDDDTDEDCVTGPFGEPNPEADLRDCFDDAGAALTDRDYELMLDQVNAARAKLEPLLSRLTQLFLGINLRRGPLAQLLTQLKNIDRQLASALKRLLRRPRLSAEPSLGAPTLQLPQHSHTAPAQWALFDLQGRLLHQLSDERALSALSLANGVYLLVFQTPHGQLRRTLHKIVVRR